MSLEFPKVDLNGVNDSLKKIEKVLKTVREEKDNAMAMEFTRVICDLLKENGITVEMTEIEEENHATNKFEVKYGFAFTGLNFSEHDKMVAKEKDKRIAELEKENSALKENKINLNDRIKFKLTPLGAEIYYHQYDEINKKAGRNIIEPHMPKIDKDGYTESTLWAFMELYGNHIGVGKRNVIDPINIFVL